MSARTIQTPRLWLPPEIVLEIALYIPITTFPTLVLVCKDWRQYFTHVVWACVKVDSRPGRGIAMWKNRIMISTLELGEGADGFARLQDYPYLESLTISEPGNVNSTEFISRHQRALTQLNLRKFAPKTFCTLLGNLQGSSTRLRELTLSDMRICMDGLWGLWPVLERLEQVHLSDVHLQANQIPTSDVVFPRMRAFHVRHPNQLTRPEVLLSWIQRCPNLTTLTLHWIQDESFVARFVRLVGTWPKLNRLSLKAHSFNDGNLSTLLQGLESRRTQNAGEGQNVAEQKLSLCLHKSEPQAPSVVSIERIRPLFSCLRGLCVRSHHGFTSEILQAVLSNCPSLELLSGYCIKAGHIIQGQPWVCRGLRELSMCIIFSSDTIAEDQLQVFEQLATLTKLKTLHLDGVSGPGVQRLRFRETVDLRLEAGLGQLSTLQSLRKISFGYTDQRMGEQEIRWMMDHWRLEVICGQLNTLMQQEERVMLESQLRRHEIVIKGVECHKCSLCK
ncbi:hypothetical protein B0O80DRAFT_532588 [Mortierella sp. GBAus27b]|nr:hypothetical protein B0O80DRAFT_532588 [Mortierella sp. GBAus27b]